MSEDGPEMDSDTVSCLVWGRGEARRLHAAFRIDFDNKDEMAMLLKVYVTDTMLPSITIHNFINVALFLIELLI